MGRKSIVIEVMEKKLSPYGFRYAKYESNRWIFRREVNNVGQEVVIQQSRWGGGKSYTVEISTEVNPLPLRIPQFVKEPQYKTASFLDFESEEERKKVLENIGDIVVKYGINILNENSKGEKPKYFQVTSFMYRKLYNEHESMTQKFMERHCIKKINEEQIFSMLEEELVSTFGKEYEQVQDKLIELAAIYGTVIVEKIGGYWEFNSDCEETYIAKVPLSGREFILSNLVDCWSRKDKNSIKENYVDLVRRIKSWVNSLKQTYGEEWEKYINKRIYSVPKCI